MCNKTYIKERCNEVDTNGGHDSRHQYPVRGIEKITELSTYTFSISQSSLYHISDFSFMGWMMTDFEGNDR